MKKFIYFIASICLISQFSMAHSESESDAFEKLKEKKYVANSKIIELSNKIIEDSKLSDKFAKIPENASVKNGGPISPVHDLFITFSQSKDPNDKSLCKFSCKIVMDYKTPCEDLSVECRDSDGNQIYATQVKYSK